MKIFIAAIFAMLASPAFADNELLKCHVYDRPGFSRGGFFPVPRYVRSVVVCTTIALRTHEGDAVVYARTWVFVTKKGKEYCRIEGWYINDDLTLYPGQSTCPTFTGET